ncbi:MAG TPA: hypothetical protein VD767_01575 [Thermomicrobiales bacterium]|nr:hypothetical protein [Thermomicrobiales bacterium]
MNGTPPPASPLDPFLTRFLAAVKQREDGVQPGAELRAVAEALDLPAPFVDALFTSARKRGLLKPAYGRGNKVRWNVSTAGEQLIGTAYDASEPVAG